jgi:hypothetical protein
MKLLLRRTLQHSVILLNILSKHFPEDDKLVNINQYIEKIQ